MNKNIFLIILFTLTSIFAISQNDEIEKIRLLFIFDGSNSMNAQWEKSSKIRVAKKLMIQTLLLQVE